MSMATTNLLEMVMFGLSGLCWCITYIVIFYRGFKDKAVGMPLLALSLNIGWEFIMSFVYTSQTSAPFRFVCICWVAIDIVLLIQEFMYGKEDMKYFFPNITSGWHKIIVIIAVIGGYYFTYYAIPAWNNYQTGMFAAALMNVSMSYLFVTMLINRGSIKGQSFYIALFKLLGTDLFGGVTFGFIVRKGSLMNTNPSPLIAYLDVVCLVFDLMYLIMLINQYHKEGLSVWTRKPLK